MTIVLLVAMGLSFSGPPMVQASEPASVRGFVVDVATNAPIANAEVELAGTIRRGNRNQIAVSTTATGGSGEFLFSDVEPGRYSLSARLDGYVDVTAEQAGRSAPSVVIEPGQNVTGMTLRMDAGGVIAGTVLDVERQAVAEAPVAAYRRQYDANMERWLWEPLEYSTTDARGEFRIDGLPPGQFVVHATPPTNVERDDSLASIRNSEAFRQALPRRLQSAIRVGAALGGDCRDGDAPIYYPNTPDLRQAARVAVDHGSERYLEIVMPREPVFAVRGAVIDPTPLGRRPTIVTLSSKAIEISECRELGDDGTFEFRNVAPGTYDINVILSTNRPAGYVQPPRPDQTPLPLPVIPTTDPDRLVAHMEVTVINEDVEDLVIVPEAMTVSGTVETGDGGTLPRGVWVAIRGPGLSSNMPPPAEVGEDGAFTIAHVPERDYRLVITELSGGMPSGLPTGWYVESARMGGIDALDAAFRIDRSWVSQPLEITLARSSSTLTIQVDDAAIPADGIFVVAVPDEARRHRPYLYRTGWTDDGGFLSFDAIAPGEYRVFAWERVAANAWLDPVYIAGIESRGRLVRVGENGRESAEVRVIR